MTAAYLYRFDRQVSNLPKVADVLIAESGVKTHHSPLESYVGTEGGHWVIFYGNLGNVEQKRTSPMVFLIFIQGPTQSSPILQTIISKKGNCLSAVSLTSSLVTDK